MKNTLKINLADKTIVMDRTFAKLAADTRSEEYAHLQQIRRDYPKQMMGEYILYMNGRIIGGIYDDRFLVKPTKSAKAMMPDADMELPYEGAKEMLLVDNVDNRDFLTQLLTAVYDELPAPKTKK